MLEKPLVVLKMAKGRKMKITRPREIKVKIENQGRRLTLAQVYPKTKTAPIAPKANIIAALSKKPPNPAKISLIFMSLFLYR